MNSLKVPESGLQLEGSAGKDASLPLQAFALTLSDVVIEDMIKCVQNGDGVQLALGANPTFLYGSNSHVIAPPSDSNPYDLYLTRPFESTRTADKIPHTGSLFQKPKPAASSNKAVLDKADNSTSARPKAAKSSKSTASSGLDSDIEALQNGLAAHAASREKARLVDNLPAKKGTIKVKGKLLSGYNSTPRSIPQSPGQVSLGSPSMTPSASQQQTDRTKEDRAVLVHELAVSDRSLDYLSKRWSGEQEDLEPTLRKVADYISDAKKWAIKKLKWRELDVWNYDYDTQEARQKAIDNAVRQYDKQRVSISEPEWERLLPKEERGTGKCLSRVQANLVKTSTPSINVEMADGSGTPRDNAESLDMGRARAGGEPMSRSGSNPLPTKPKKPSAQDAQVKRLLGKSKAKATPAKAPSSKVSSVKASPTKARPTSVKPTGGRVLSQAIISNSDTSGDEGPPVVKSKPAPKPAPKPVSRPAPRPKETVIAKPRPVMREPMKQQTVTKRPREDDDSSSSSGTPLSKRIKPKQPLPGPRLKHRPSDASQNSRGTVTSTSLKSKNTSPTKSSPLASSPPTNASDLENEAPSASIATKKRKAEGANRPAAAKRAATSFSDDLVEKAQAFKVCYQKYEALHHEVSALENPPSRKLGHLREMRDRLKTMKMEIYSECPPERS
ncbi:hypothetical protein FZEAL_6442 [Fusarium zealandicum]|uniref:Uncharacterized protein n=1 Tax=Fusarium zealandicum TaxID=1053134 RepID=A0A8H4UHX9_9HYPO|nr:hypothetical protein FZEAL_6442 [Fusarium zealandicum]